MSADGEVEVQVNAEGVDDAAGEIADSGGVGGGGGPGPGGGGSLRGSLKGGLLGGALVAALGPLIDILEPIQGVLEAFLAPVAVMLLRLFAPVLRFLLTKALPVWMEYMPLIGDVVKGVLALSSLVLLPLLATVAIVALAVQGIRTAAEGLWNWATGGAASDIGASVWAAISSGASWLANGAFNIASYVWSFVSRLPGQIWEEMRQLPDLIGQSIAERLPNVPDSGDVTEAGQDLLDRGRDFVEGGTNVVLNGGLGSFVDRVEETSDIDIP